MVLVMAEESQSWAEMMAVVRSEFQGVDPS